jgi:hypothetical protein
MTTATTSVGILTTALGSLVTDMISIKVSTTVIGKV